jgi:hypothetical protein
MNSDFASMTKVQLRAYLVAHPDDQEAFYAFVDRFTAQASSETHGMPQTQSDIEAMTKLIQQKVAQTRTSQ